MPIETLGDIAVHYRDEGPAGAPALVLAHSLGTDLSIWDEVIAHLPEGMRVVRYDLRGHGQSDVPDGPYFMGDLVGDAARLMDHLGVKDAVFVGLSIGGIVAQGLAAERLDLLRGIVLSNTAAKIGTSSIWNERIEAVRAGGIEAIADATIERWLGRDTRRDAPAKVAATRAMLTASPLAGYLGCMAAIAETDLVASTASLRLPTLGIAGAEDGSTPPDLVRETVDSIPGAKFYLMRRLGHMACVEDPAAYAAVLTGFLKEIGHI